MASEPIGDDQATEDPTRPFEQWLDYYLSDSDTVDALGELGAKCRDAADQLVKDLIAHADDPARRARFTRSLGFLIYDSYLHDGWDHHEP